MQMAHGLACVSAAVGHNTVAVVQSFGPGDGGDHLKNVGHDTAVFRRDAVAVGNVDFGDHQNVGGSLGIDIPEGQNRVIFVNPGRGVSFYYRMFEVTVKWNLQSSLY